GGSEVSARVVGWSSIKTAGVQSVTGVGFSPSLVITLHVGAGYTQPPPQKIADMAIGIGVMDAARGQPMNDLYATNDAKNVEAQRYPLSVRVIAGIVNDLTVGKEAAFASMDPDGFSVNWTVNDNAATTLLSLALGGVQARAGSFVKGPGPAQAVSGVGLTP